MKKSKLKKNSPPTLIVIALAVAVVFGYLSYIQKLQQPVVSKNVETTPEATTTVKTEPEYTYKTVHVGSKTFTEKYKDGDLVETVLVK